MEKGEKVHHQRSKREVWHLTTWPKIQNPHHQLKRFCSGVCWSNDFFQERERRDKVHHQQSKREVCHLTEVRIKNFTIRSAKIVKMFCSGCWFVDVFCLFFSRKHRKKEREARNGTDRQTDRQKERERQRDRDRKTESDRQTDRQRQSERDRQTERQRQTDR